MGAAPERRNIIKLNLKQRFGLMSLLAAVGSSAWAGSAWANAPIAMNAPSEPITMVAFQDPWPAASERWWDISSYRRSNRDYYNQFNAWVSGGAPNGGFDYGTRASNVSLTYDRSPSGKVFVGHIVAQGLKPNFAYQLKLAGKPVMGARGTGTGSSYVSVASRSAGGAAIENTVLDGAGNPTPINGDDWANQQLGYAGRWWNDTAASGNTNAATDSVYQANTSESIYGYLFMGVFVTDWAGRADFYFSGSRSYHITWQDWQNGPKQVLDGTYSIAGHMESSSPTRYYGYGAYAPSTGSASRQQNGKTKVSLYYELEPGRPNPVALASGTYHCRLLITEETFHNLYGATNGALGGKWKTVMATEDFSYASPSGLPAPDTSAANDVVFTIS